MVYVTISMILMAAVYQLMLIQIRSYGTQREQLDVRGSIKSAATLLTWELQEASARGGDLSNIAANSFTVRSVQGAGVVCGRDSARSSYGLYGISGQFSATTNDSLLLFAANGLSRGDDSWRAVKITAVTDPVSGGVPKCFWGDAGLGQGTIVNRATTGTVVPALAVKVTGNSNGVWVGAPALAFRQTTYGLYLDSGSGRWWLGRKVGAATSYEKLTGPLRSQTQGGLVFTYLDANGVVTTDPTKVAQVDIVIRGESFGQAFGASSTLDVRRDTVWTRVALRG
jgi:hypothetical protein